MARRQGKHSRSTTKRTERRRRALNEAAAAPVPPTVLPAEATEPIVRAEQADGGRPTAPEPPLVVEHDDEHRDRRWAWVMVPIGGLPRRRGLQLGADAAADHSADPTAHRPADAGADPGAHTRVDCDSGGHSPANAGADIRSVHAGPSDARTDGDRRGRR